jgi:peptidoglycan LD-endopeptidase LytH
MDKHAQLKSWLNNNPNKVGKVVDFDAGADSLLALDLTDNNTELSLTDIADTERFAGWISHKLEQHNCLYGIGGYFEHRTIYGRSALFDTAGEPRRLHLGIDIWADAGTTVYAPLDGRVHSFKDNNNFGDYGPTIILEHNLEGLQLYTLYGHLSRQSLDGLYEGKPVNMNQVLGQFGDVAENGQWPPHLHFQLMFDMEGLKGDYPGVCRYSEKERYRLNIPDPNLVLKFPEGKR